MIGPSPPPAASRTPTVVVLSALGSYRCGLTCLVLYLESPRASLSLSTSMSSSAPLTGVCTVTDVRLASILVLWKVDDGCGNIVPPGGWVNRDTASDGPVGSSGDEGLTCGTPLRVVEVVLAPVPGFTFISRVTNVCLPDEAFEDLRVPPLLDVVVSNTPLLTVEIAPGERSVMKLMLVFPHSWVPICPVSISRYFSNLVSTLSRSSSKSSSSA
mmetsp:Transcript_17714/g.49579  ORF Transcript_17714/g.49579 Transcript_17714/m.49579 type:complete len:214 (+) Transcript_17714:647-1288(+)